MIYIAVFGQDASSRGNDIRAHLSQKISFGVSLAGIVIGLVSIVVLGSMFGHYAANRISCPHGYYHHNGQRVCCGSVTCTHGVHIDSDTGCVQCCDPYSKWTVSSTVMLTIRRGVRCAAVWIRRVVQTVFTKIILGVRNVASRQVITPPPIITTIRMVVEKPAIDNQHLLQRLMAIVWMREDAESVVWLMRTRKMVVIVRI